MGANQSSTETRSVSMDNPTPSGVIDISEEVVQRLKLGISKVKKEETKAELSRPVPVTEPKKASPPTPPPPPPSPPPSVQQKPEAQPAPSKTFYPNAIAEPPVISPVPRFADEPIITSMEMRRQKEIELRQNDEMWRARMEQLEQTLNKTNAIMEKEYEAAVEEVRKRFVNSSGTQKQPPCQDLKAQLIACYRAYPGETLNCAEEVKRFAKCVDVHRIQKLDREQGSAKAA